MFPCTQANQHSVYITSVDHTEAGSSGDEDKPVSMVEQHRAKMEGKKKKKTKEERMREEKEEQTAKQERLKEVYHSG